MGNICCKSEHHNKQLCSLFGISQATLLNLCTGIYRYMYFSTCTIFIDKNRLPVSYPQDFE